MPIDKREFAKISLDKISRTFIIHIAALKAILIQLFFVAQLAV